MQEINLNEYDRTPRCKPTYEVIQALHRQKKSVIKQYQQEVNLKEGFEYDLCKMIANLKERGLRRANKINKIIDRIKKIQKEKNITEFQRNFIKGLLTTYTSIKSRTRQRIINEILSYAQVKEKVVAVKYLQKEDRKQGVEEIKIKERNKIKKFYSFL